MAQIEDQQRQPNGCDLSTERVLENTIRWVVFREVENHHYWTRNCSLNRIEQNENAFVFGTRYETAVLIWLCRQYLRMV